jgi:hypothetical protein
MLPNPNNATITYGAPRLLGAPADEHEVIARFAARVNALGTLSPASLGLQIRLLEEVKIVARSIDVRTEAGVELGYGRRVLFEVHGRWSLAAISLRPGQHTEMHDHGGWGCAATVQGMERDRRYSEDAAGNPVLNTERDYPPGTGYVFDPEAVHQPIGADPLRVTVALHFLVHDSRHHNAMPEPIPFPSRHSIAA